LFFYRKGRERHRGEQILTADLRGGTLMIKEGIRP
jgi:hypothetical protein